jgi:hypothetical protein
MAIFPNSIQAIDRLIVSFLDYKDQITFSQLNKASHQLIKTVGILLSPEASERRKQLFEVNHPQFVKDLKTEEHVYLVNKFKRKFVKFCTYYSENCWAVTDYLLRSGRIPYFCDHLLKIAISKRTAKYQQEIVDLKAEKNELEKELEQKIGDSNHPNSQIYKAKVAYEQASADEHFTTWREAIQKAIDLVETEEQKKQLYDLFFVRTYSTPELQINKFPLQEESFFETLRAIDEQLPPLFYSLTNKYSKNIKKIQSTGYEELAKIKFEINGKLKSIDKKIESLQSKINSQFSDHSVSSERKKLTKLFQDVLSQDLFLALESNDISECENSILEENSMIGLKITHLLATDPNYNDNLLARIICYFAGSDRLHQGVLALEGQITSLGYAIAIKLFASQPIQAINFEKLHDKAKRLSKVYNFPIEGIHNHLFDAMKKFHAQQDLIEILQEKNCHHFLNLIDSFNNQYINEKAREHVSLESFENKNMQSSPSELQPLPEEEPFDVGQFSDWFSDQRTEENIPFDRSLADREQEIHSALNTLLALDPDKNDYIISRIINHVAYLQQTGQDSPLIDHLTEQAYNLAIELYASQPIEKLTLESCQDKVKRLAQAFNIPTEQIDTDLHKKINELQSFS